MDLNQYRSIFSAESDAPGWNAIDKQLEQIYPGVTPKHYGTVVKYMIGGQDPIDGISIFRCGTADNWHYHYVTYGFSRLYYDEEAINQEYSGFGFELTFRLKPFSDDPEWPVWPCDMMQNLARYVFSSRKWFDDYHWIPANGPIRLDTDTEITGLVFLTDPKLGRIETPHGKLQFLQVIGVTDTEITAIRNGKLDVKTLTDSLKANDELLVTDLLRSST